ncbi:hypothetical protein, variant [Capsaspora owczarzaki ATCC 30864]|uniref:Essential for reactive oxygen species protein n=1 Tax=Capsaspora owczarzaki (strain ATCC 30864) TaxID=595528 RepID=A0A0D2VY63_CAPO3|nr:hypothetical protein, variant [Capsaspora owczarzaki ATCC 30864]
MNGTTCEICVCECFNAHLFCWRFLLLLTHHHYICRNSESYTEHVQCIHTWAATRTVLGMSSFVDVRRLPAFLSFGVLLFMFNPTTLFWRVVQVLFCAFLGVSNMELWEEVIVDKSAGQISMRRYNFIDWTRARYVVQIADVDEVIVGQHALGFGGFSQLCFRAELVLNTGAVVPLTDTYSLGQGKNVDKIVDFLSDFVGLEVDPNEEHTVRKTVRMRLEDDDAAATAAQQSSSDDESDPDEDQEAKYLQQRAADSLNATN